MILFFYDCETTGLDPEHCAIHQLSGKISKAGKIVESFNYHIQPFEGADIDLKALAVSEVTEAQIMAYTSEEEIYKELCLMLLKYVDPFAKDPDQKMVTVGYNNSGFDDEFLWWFFKRHSNTPPSPNYRQGFSKGNFFNKLLSLDMLQAAKLVVGPGKHDGLENFKLGTVATYLGCLSINEGKLHDADFDIDTTINLFKYFYSNGYIKTFQGNKD